MKTAQLRKHEAPVRSPLTLLPPPQAFVAGRLRLRPSGTHPQVQTAQREAAAAPQVPGESEQLLQQHPSALLPLGRTR